MKIKNLVGSFAIIALVLSLLYVAKGDKKC